MELSVNLLEILVDHLASIVFSFAWNKYKKTLKKAQLTREVSRILAPTEHFQSLSRIQQVLSESQLAGILERFSLEPQSDIVKDISEEMIDGIEPSINELSTVRSVISNLCILLFHYANPISDEGQAMENRLVQSMERTTQRQSRQLLQVIQHQRPTAHRCHQVIPLHRFIETKDAAFVNSPLSGVYIPRDTEIDDCVKELQLCRALVLSGCPGTGKTRLGIEIIKRVADEEHRQVLCILGSGPELFRELNQTLQRFRHYALLVDDANELTNIEYITSYIVPNDDSIDVKAVFTVRDYAREKVIADLSYRTQFKVKKLAPIKNDTMVSIIKSFFNDFTNEAAEYIARISEGNPRIALMAAQCAHEGKSLEAISNAEQIFDLYYKRIIESQRFWSNVAFIKTAAIISIISIIDLNNVASLVPILNDCGISEAAFREAALDLHQTEIVDIYKNRAVKVSDQCFANYLVKWALFDKKYFSLKTLTQVAFTNYRKKLIETISMIFNVFGSQQIKDQIISTVCEIWDEWERTSNDSLPDFTRAFYPILGSRPLVWLNDMILKAPLNELDYEKIDFDKERENHSITDDWLNILIGYKNRDDYETAIELIFLYLNRNPSIYMQFYHGLSKFGCPDEESYHFEYRTQLALAEFIKQTLQSQPDRTISSLCVRVCIYLLGFTFQSTVMTDKSTVQFRMFSIPNTQEVINYRQLLWDSLLIAYRSTSLDKEVFDFFRSYPDLTVKDINIYKPIIQSDWQNIVQFVSTNFLKDRLQHLITIERLLISVSNIIEPNEKTSLLHYLDSSRFEVLKILTTDYSIFDTETVKDRQDRTHENLQQYAETLDKEKFNELLSCACEAIHVADYLWDASSNLATILSMLKNKPDFQLHSLLEYALRGAPLDINPQESVRNLLTFYPFEYLWTSFSCFDHPVSYRIRSALLSLIPEDQVTQFAVEHLLDFYAQSTEYFQHEDIHFLERYKKTSADIVYRVIKVLLQNISMFPQLGHLYSRFVFTEDQWIIQECENDTDSPWSLYMLCHAVHSRTDYRGKCFLAFIREKPERFQEFIMVACNVEWRDESMKKLAILWPEDNAFDLFDMATQIILEKTQYHFQRKSHFSWLVTTPESSSSKTALLNWLKSRIVQHKDDLDWLEMISATISDMPQEWRKDILLTWFRSLPDEQVVAQTTIKKMSYSWTGSELPILQGEIDFLGSLLPHLSGLKLLPYKEKVSRTINGLRQEMSDQEFREFVEDN